jgi:endoglucanase
MNTPHSHLFRALHTVSSTVLRWTSITLALVLSACTTPPKSNLELFPPAAMDKPPGASDKAFATAKALGRGINLGNMLEAPTEGAWGFSVTPELIDVVKQGGFNSVRLPVRWSNHALAAKPFTVDEAFMARVEGVVNSLIAKDLYVVINLHHYRQLDGDAPDDGDLPVDAALAEERYLTLWQQVASRLFAKSDRLIFELYNEPHGRLDAARWNDLQARALAVVRQYNPKRIAMVSPVQWGNATELVNLRVPNDAHLIVTFHHYEPFKFTHQGAFWIKPELPTGITCCDAAQIKAITDPLDLAKAWSEANRYPVFMGEFGSYKAGDMVSRANFTRTMRQEAEKRGIPWAYWELASHFGLYDTVKKAFIAPLQKALMGPD